MSGRFIRAGRLRFVRIWRSGMNDLNEQAYTAVLFFLDLAGTFIFSITGAFKAVKYELDILGVIVLALLTGIGGGMIRDSLLGDFPVAALQSEAYFTVCLIGALLVFFLAARIAYLWKWVKIGDALGLAIFTVIGAAKGYALGLGPFGVAVSGMLTACGGGVIRDLMVREIPTVIRTDFYATAAILGSWLLYALTRWTPLSPAVVLTVSGFFVFILRVTAMRLKLNLPRVKAMPAPPEEMRRRYREEKRNRKGGSR